MRLSVRSLYFLVILTCAACASDTENQGLWPISLLESESGSLAIEYRLTDECDIDSDFEIVEHPNVEVTRDEILGAVGALLRRATREDISEEAFATASLEVFGQESIPDRVLEKGEYEAMRDLLERLGPWPQVRTLPLGSRSLRCTFDPAGTLIKVEKKSDDETDYSELKESLNKQGPFRLRWKIED